MLSPFEQEKKIKIVSDLIILSIWNSCSMNVLISSQLGPQSKFDCSVDCSMLGLSLWLFYHVEYLIHVQLNL